MRIQRVKQSTIVVLLFLVSCSMITTVITTTQNDVITMDHTEPSKLYDIAAVGYGPNPLYLRSQIAAGWDFMTTIIDCGGDGYFMTGRESYYGPYTMFARYDSDGYLLWDQVYGSGKPLELFLIDMGSSNTVYCQDGGYLMAGLLQNISSGFSDLCIVKLNDTGEYQWHSTYPIAATPSDLSLVACSGGGYAILATRAPMVMLLRLDNAGSIIWNSTYIGSLDHNPKSGEIIEYSDGGFAYNGYVHNVTANTFDPLLVRVDASGNQICNRTYFTNDGTTWGEMHALVECADGGFAMAGRYIQEGIVIKTDNVGTYEWNTTFGVHNSDFGQAIVENPDGQLIVAGGVNNGVGLYCIQANGTLLWQRAYASTGDRVDVILDKDGGWVIGGQSLSGSDYPTLIGHVPEFPHWDVHLTDQFVELGQNVRYDLNATVTGSVQAYGLNDTFFFSMDSNGVLTNKIPLSLANYSLLLTASDMANNLVSSEIIIHVEDTLAPDWVIAPTNQRIEYGLESLDYQIPAVDYDMVEGWFLNDTVNFSFSMTIYAGGGSTIRITSGLLEIGVYPLELSVFDPHGNSRTEVFTITVEDTIAPEWITYLGNVVLTYNEPLEIIFNADDLSGVESWVVNDTIHFNIDSSGKLTNRVTLEPGTYGLLLIVKDSSENTLFGELIVTVLDPPSVTTPSQTTTIPTTSTSATSMNPDTLDTSLLLAISGIGVVSVVIIVVFLKKKK